MKKTRSDSVMDAQPQNVRDAVESWLLDENISYLAAAKRLFEDFGVRLAPSSLQAFRERCSQRRMLDRIAASRANANEVVKKFNENQADMYAALVGMAGQLAFESSMDGQKFDPETFFNFTKLVMTAQKQSLEQRTLELAEQKYRDLVAEKRANIERELKSAKNSGGISPETLAKIEAELKLL